MASDAAPRPALIDLHDTEQNATKRTQQTNKKAAVSNDVRTTMTTNKSVISTNAEKRNLLKSSRDRLRFYRSTAQPGCGIWGDEMSRV